MNGDFSSREIFDDCYAIRIPGHEKKVYLIYAPLAATVFLCDETMPEKLKLAAEGDRSPALSEVAETVQTIRRDSKKPSLNLGMHFSHLTILPTNRCNFNCSYCYSRKSRAESSSVISEHAMLKMLDWFISQQFQQNETLSICFYGGGEPLLAFDRIQTAVKYMESHCNRRIFWKIITNGSLLSDEIIDFFAEKKFEITVSFDILPEIQQQTRGHFDCVSEKISRLCENGVIPEINTVILPRNVALIPQMTEYVNKEWPSIQYLHLEPVIGADFFHTPEEYRIFLKDFRTLFLQERKKAADFSIELDCSFLKKLEHTAARFCPGDLTLTPEGDITSCPCVSSPADSHYNFYIYGKAGCEVQLDRKKFNELLDFNQLRYKECTKCPVKWHCGGGCLHRRFTMPAEYQQIFCVFMKEFALDYLLDSLDRTYRSEYGISLKQMLNGGMK